VQRQTASLDLTELEAELDHVLDCTRALRERLKQANLLAAAIAKGEDVRYRLAQPIAGIRRRPQLSRGKGSTPQRAGVATNSP
jgi:hypothetical protein